MVTIDLGPAPPPPTGLLGDLPRRLSLTRPELRLVAEQAGGAPLPFEPVDDTLPTRLHEPRASLARRGLLVDTVLDEGLLGAVGLLASPEVAVDLDVGAGSAQVRAWHRQRGGAVAALATGDGVVFELAWFPVERWADELARAAVVPEGVAGGRSDVPDLVELPYGLVDAAAEVARPDRDGLLSALAAQHGVGLEVVPVLAALAAETRGRLRALVADVSTEQAAVVGVVSWVLLADGWRALRSHRAATGDRVEVRRVGPADLAAQLAPVLAEVRAWA